MHARVFQVSAGTFESQKRMWDPFGLEFPKVVISLMWVLRTNWGSLGKQQLLQTAEPLKDLFLLFIYLVLVI